MTPQSDLTARLSLSTRHPNKYRPEIDGLRALSVLVVLGFHLGISSFRGGYIGVDVFFVISGYLITGIVIDDIDGNNFSLANFYVRRI
jgi:peptidoglycan/LPS O-acetylase OafA/YrhL